LKEYSREKLSELSIEGLTALLPCSQHYHLKSLVMERLEEKEISDSKYEGEKFKLFQEYGLKCLCRDVMIRLTDEVLEGAEDWSLKCLMASCLDFAKEMTALQHVDSELRVSVLVTRKFHTEPAGEGIEHSWGVTKGVYQSGSH
jgi:hypothetical protein